MKVYILITGFTADFVEQRAVKSVHSTLESAKAVYPNVEWESLDGNNCQAYVNTPCEYEDMVYIEEHDLI